MFKCKVIDKLREALARLERIEAKQDVLVVLLNAVLAREKSMSKELDDLQAAVTKTTDLEQSAITLIRGLADALAAAKTDPVKIQALSDELKVKAQALADAIAANTPTPPSP